MMHSANGEGAEASNRTCNVAVSVLAPPRIGNLWVDGTKDRGLLGRRDNALGFTHNLIRTPLTLAKLFGMPVWDYM